MNFVAIDFETANKNRYSACSLGMIVVENRQIIDTKYWLIKPPEMYFDPFNVSLHGITEKDIYNKPEFKDLWFEIKEYFNNKIVFAHNASFDIYVLRDLLDYYKIDHPKIKFACTVNLSQKIWNLKDYKLETVANHLNYKFNHHNALEDAKVCAEIVLQGCSNINVSSIEELLKQLKIRKKALPKKDNNLKVKSYQKKDKKNNENITRTGCLVFIIPIIILIIILYLIIGHQ
jgi:DNA polymerase-3 subunit epsilon